MERLGTALASAAAAGGVAAAAGTGSAGGPAAMLPNSPWVQKAHHPPHRARKFAPGVLGEPFHPATLTCPPANGSVGIRDLGALKLLRTLPNPS